MWCVDVAVCLTRGGADCLHMVQQYASMSVQSSPNFIVQYDYVRVPWLGSVAICRVFPIFGKKVARTRLPSVWVPELIPVLGSQPAGDTHTHTPV